MGLDLKKRSDYENDRRKYKRLNKTIMNENLNLVEILKDCPKGTKLYSTIFGEVKLYKVDKYNNTYPICVEDKECGLSFITSDGRLLAGLDGECTLFPSREQRDWSKFKPKQPKFDPKTLKPFDKVLARDRGEECWRCGLFSHIRDEEGIRFKYVTTNDCYKRCIPYNDETEHLVGTTKEAPEFYRYWED